MSQVALFHLFKYHLLLEPSQSVSFNACFVILVQILMTKTGGYIRFYSG